MNKKPKIKKIKPSVGLILVAKEPKTDRLIAVLRTRATIKFCEVWEEHPWPRACQVSVHGKSLCWETPTQTLHRKAKEQLGERFYNIARLDDREFRLLVEDNRRKVKTYGLCVRQEYIRHIRTDSSSFGIRIFYLDQISKIRPLRRADRWKKITDLDEVAMFPDEIRALKKIRGNRQLLSFLYRHH